MYQAYIISNNYPHPHSEKVLSYNGRNLRFHLPIEPSAQIGLDPTSSQGNQGYLPSSLRLRSDLTLPPRKETKVICHRAFGSDGHTLHPSFLFKHIMCAVYPVTILEKVLSYNSIIFD
jgi:hypothetical protein